MNPNKKINLRSIFISGFFIMLPIMVTVVAMVFVFNLLDSWLAPYGAYILRFFGVNLPPDWKNIPGFGIVATFILIFVAGLFGTNYLGRRLLKFVDQFMGSVPVINYVYSGIRQLMDVFASSQGTTAFKTVVMVEFPLPGAWSLGFLTTPSFAAARKAAQAKLVNVFIPTCPIPSQGILLMVPENRLRVLPMAVEDAFKMFATLGLVQKERPARVRKPAGKRKRA